MTWFKSRQQKCSLECPKTLCDADHVYILAWTECVLGKFICKFLRCLNVDDILVKSWGLILYLAEDKRTEYFKLAQMFYGDNDWFEACLWNTLKGV